MNPILIGLLWGLLIGIIIVPIGAIAFWKYKQTKMRRMIKRLLNNGEILQPMDKKDYNAEGWKDKFPVDALPKEVEKLTDIFIKKEKSPPKEEPVEEEVKAPYQGPVQEGMDVEHFRETGIQKPIQDEEKNE